MLTVLERELVVVVSSFEAVFCHANINLCFAGCGSDSCFALLTVHALSTTSSTKQLSLPHPAKQRFILAWQNTASKLDTTTTSSLSSTVSIPTTLSYQSTSGTKETKTPISRSSGQLSRKQALIGETRRAAICVWQRSSVFYPLTDLLSLIRDLN